jgi:peroxiredoxin
MDMLRLRVWQGRQGLALGLVALVTLYGPPAMGQPAIMDLLRALNLSNYPSGMRPPAFNSSTPAGQTVALADLRGRVVLLTFWTTWCAECRPEMPLFESLHRDFAAQGLAVLGVNAREGTGAIIAQYAQELGLTFPLVVDPQGRISTAYGVIGLPTTFLISRDGRAVALATGPRAWGSALARTIIQTLLAEPAARQEAP